MMLPFVQDSLLGLGKAGSSKMAAVPAIRPLFMDPILGLSSFPMNQRWCTGILIVGITRVLGLTIGMTYYSTPKIPRRQKIVMTS